MHVGTEPSHCLCKVLTSLILLEGLEAGGRAVLADEQVVGHEGHQLAQLVADAGLVEPARARRAQQLHYVQVPVFAAADANHTHCDINGIHIFIL